jgi:hypothetical protein
MIAQRCMQLHSRHVGHQGCRNSNRAKLDVAEKGLLLDDSLGSVKADLIDEKLYRHYGNIQIAGGPVSFAPVSAAAAYPCPHMFLPVHAS